MANTKLTLSVDAGAISFVKRYAKRQQTSVSKLVEDFFDEIASKEKQEEISEEGTASKPISPKVLALTGIIKGKYPDNYDYREAYRAHLSKKHGL
jgi:hypothetical protein